jgi:hypothetical protein
MDTRHHYRMALGQTARATYWNVHLIVTRLAHDIMAPLPPPTNGILQLFGDGSHADKRGSKNPVVQQGRKSQYQPWCRGLRFVLLMAAWDGYRVPLSLRIILPKRPAHYRSETALFREMVEEFGPPHGAQMVSVEGEAAYGSQANMRMVQDRDKAAAARRWGFVCAIARPRKMAEEQTLKNLVTHWPRMYYQRPWMPREYAGQGRKTFWIYDTDMCWRHAGAVTLVLSKKGRNVEPHHTQLLVTNLAELTPRQVVCIDHKSGPVSCRIGNASQGWAWASTKSEGMTTVPKSRWASPWWPTGVSCGRVIMQASLGNPGVCFSCSVRCVFRWFLPPNPVYKAVLGRFW